MKKLFTILLLLASNAFAQPATPEAVASECMRQMAMGICSTRPDRSTITPGQTMLISGVGRVSYSAYMDYMDLFNEAVPSDPAMCDLAMTMMTTKPGSDHDLIARALWTPPVEAETKITASEMVDKALKAAAGLSALMLFGLLAYSRRSK